MTSLERLLLASTLMLCGLVVFLIVVGVILHRARAYLGAPRGATSSHW